MKQIKLIPRNLSQSEISAASSLLSIGERIFVCCDDQYLLYELLKNEKWIKHEWDQSPILPVEHQARKKVKPDFEAILLDVWNDETIILIPSGSTSNRTLALKFNLTKNIFISFDLTSFFKELSEVVPLINIEGAATVGDQYLFMNRGIQNDLSSVIVVDSRTFRINKVVKVEFGHINNVLLHGSELCVFENNLYALAVAEASPNSYDDGEILGSAIFKISPVTFKILDRWQFDRAIKAEGLCRYENQWLVATDPDGVGVSEFYCFNLN